jgi:hypothetical protein
MVLLISLVLLIVVISYLDRKVPWPKPTEKVQRYVSIAEESRTLRRN